MRVEIKKCGVTDGTCAKCGLHVSDLDPITDAGMEDLRRSIEKAKAELVTRQRALNDARVLAATHSQQKQAYIDVRNRLLSKKKTVEKSIELQQKDDIDMSDVEIDKLVVHLQGSEWRAVAAGQATDRTSKAMVLKASERPQYAIGRKVAEIPTRYSQANALKLGEKLDEVRKIRDTWDGRSRVVTPMLNWLRIKHKDLYDLEGQLDNLQDDMLQTYAGLRAEVTQKLAIENDHPDVPMESYLAAMRAKQDEVAKVKGQAEEAKRSHEKAEQDLQVLRDRAQRDVGKRQLIASLRKVAEMLDNGGLPMAVVRHHFQRLTALTQEFLVKLNANFQISIDQSTEVSFMFRRLDEEDAIDMPMGKLSGGQRVRLCVAFLMAAQRCLVKDVGLLVLDEPSVFCDSQGVESLIELLQGMQETLQNSEHQIWVSDHEPEMRRAFSKCISLT